MATSPAALGVKSPILRGVLLAIFGLLILFYLADFSWYELRAHIPKFGTAIGTVHRIRLLAIPAKGNKLDYEIDANHPEEDVPCSRSVFPQGGFKPCWYIARHAKDPIQM
jgi:hypothetical protein